MSSAFLYQVLALVLAGFFGHVAVLVWAVSAIRAELRYLRRDVDQAHAGLRAADARIRELEHRLRGGTS